MPLDASAVRCIAYEINNLLSTGRIEKIYQPEKDEIVLVVKSMGRSMRLVISANSQNPRIYITENVKENPSEPPMFCMLMRKHILSGRICDVKSVDFERIIDICIESRNEMGDVVKKHLICEIMGKNSNIILTNEEGKIIDCIKHIDITVSRVRNLFPGLTYHLPPDGERENPLESKKEDFERILTDSGEGKSCEKAILSALCGVSPLMAREAVYTSCGRSDKLIGELVDGEREALARCLWEMFGRIRENIYTPQILYKEGEGKPFDFAVYEITQYEGDIVKKREESICAVLELFYQERDTAERMRSRSYALMKNITSLLDRLRKKCVLLEDTLKESAERDKYKIFGDIITANLYRMSQGDKILKAVNFYDEEQKEIEIALDESKSPAKNAQQYYRKYQKAKTAEVEAAKQLEKAVEEIWYLESVVSEIEDCKTPSELEEIRGELIDAGVIKTVSTKKKQVKKKISMPQRYEFEGYSIYAGKNNLQNDYLTLKMGRANDLWLHTKNIPGSHVLIKHMGEDFPPEVIEAAAVIAATNSKGKNAPRVDVDYCPVSHVKKPNGAKAGMVIYEGYNTASVAPDEKMCEVWKENAINEKNGVSG